MKTVGRFSLALASIGLGLATIGLENQSVLAQAPNGAKAGPALTEAPVASQGKRPLDVVEIGDGQPPVTFQSAAPFGSSTVPWQAQTPEKPELGPASPGVFAGPQAMGPIGETGGPEVGPGPGQFVNPYGNGIAPPVTLAPCNPNPAFGPNPQEVHESSCAAAEDCQGCAKDCNHFGFFADALYLKARGTDLIYAQPRDGSTTLSSPLGPQGILEPDYSVGFRVGMDYTINDCSSVVATFSWWDDQTHSFLAAPTSPVGAVIQSTLILPNIMNPAADGQAANGGLGLELRTADVDYKHILWGDPGHYTINWLAGARYAYLRQDLHSELSILGTTDIDSHITFEGIGPRLGLDGDVQLGRGFKLYGSGIVDLLAGHFGASYNQFNVFTGQQGNADYKNDRLVEILELELGAGWCSPKGHVVVTAGYYIAAWFDSLTTQDYINAVQANNYSNSGGNLKSDMTFDGFTFRVEFKF